MTLSIILQYIKYLPYVILVVVGLLGAWKAYDYGVDSTSLKYETFLKTEAERQKSLLNRIQAETRQRIVEHEDQIKELEKLLKENDNEASNDPNASRPALGIPSVQRLNKIR